MELKYVLKKCYCEIILKKRLLFDEVKAHQKLCHFWATGYATIELLEKRSSEYIPL